MILRKWLVALCSLWIICFCACSSAENIFNEKCVNTTIDQINYNNNINDDSYSNNNYIIIKSDKLNCIQINKVFNECVEFSINYYSTSVDPGLRILLIDLTSGSVIDEISAEISKPFIWNNFSGKFTKQADTTTVRILISENANASIAFRNILFYTYQPHFEKETPSDTNTELVYQKIIPADKEQEFIYEDILPVDDVDSLDDQNREWTTPVIPPSIEWVTPTIPATEDDLQPDPDWTTPVWPPPTELPEALASTYDEWIVIGIIFIVLTAAAMIAIIVLIATMPSSAKVAAANSSFALPRVQPTI